MRVGQSMTDVVGHTPVVQLHKVVPQGAADVYVKLEWFNPTGSYKDRMALAMIEGADRRGELQPGQTVVEYTGGSTGSSLVITSLPDKFSALTPIREDVSIAIPPR